MSASFFQHNPGISKIPSTSTARYEDASTDCFHIHKWATKLWVVAADLLKSQITDEI